MSSTLAQLFRDSGKQVIARHLKAMIGRPAEALEDGTYRNTVVTPAWKEMPVPCKLLGRRRLRWDELFEQLREAAYDTSSGTVKFSPDATAKTTEVFKQAVAHVQQLFEAASRTVASVSETSSGPASSSEATSGPDVETSAGSPSTDADGSAEGRAIGIDLGTTYSAVSFVDAQGRPVSVENAAGDMLTPSVVFFDDDGTIVGAEARLAAAMEPDRVAECVKRDMGSKAYRKKVNGESLPPEVVSSFVLRALKADAERRIGPVAKAVITVPAYFDEPRRRATMDAGQLAGLQVLDIVNEPTAAAVCYGYESGFLQPDQDPDDAPVRRVLVYDLGGGTFDVTILEIRGNAFRAVATDGDVRLGGKDWDEKLLDLVAERFVAEHREDPRENPTSLQELWSAVETAKKTLSERQKANVFVNHLGTRARIEVTREDFESATAALLDRTRHTTELVVREAGLTWDDVDRVLLVGGSTRMPMVSQMLEGLTGRPVDRSLSPDAAVAHGAALYAELLLQKDAATSPKFEMVNVNSHSLGIVGLDKATGRRVNHVLVPKNTALPCTVEKNCKTAKPNQRSVKVEVLEGESPRPDQCTLVGVSTVRDLPAELPAGTPVRVRYHYEENGRLHVTAQVQGHDEEVTTVFSREDDLGAEDMLTWSEYVAHESPPTGP